MSDDKIFTTKGLGEAWQPRAENPQSSSGEAASVGVGLNSLNSELCQLTEDLNALWERLEPVLKRAVPSDHKSPASYGAEEDASPLWRKTADLCVQVECLRDTVRQMSRRLEV